MSQENVELARRLYPGTVDLRAVLDDPALIDAMSWFVDPEFEMVGAAVAMDDATMARPEALGRRSVFGIEGFVDSWKEFLAAWETWVITATEFIEVDHERVLVYLDIRARSKTHGVEIPIEGANLLTLRDGKLKRLELFSTRPPALEAAGLSE